MMTPFEVGNIHVESMPEGWGVCDRFADDGKDTTVWQSPGGDEFYITIERVEADDR